MAELELLKGKYIASMDLYPLEVKEFNRCYQFYENLKEGRFTTTKCKECGYEAFPPRVICPECLSEDLEWIDWPTEGTVLVFTEEEVGVPLGFETPLIHALVDLGGKRKLFVRIVNCKAGELKEGDKVRLKVFPIQPIPVQLGRETVEKERYYYAFEPVK